MSYYNGPKIVSDGLALHLDIANPKSFKGEPTTNEIVVVTWSGDGANQGAFVKESVLITSESLKYNGYETYLWSPGASYNCYLNADDLSVSRTSTVWTFSCYVKRQDGAAITSLSVYMYYPSSDGSAAGTIESVGNGWYRISRTRTGTNNYLGLVGFAGFDAGYKYYLSGVQLEKKSYPTTVVATNTTRGYTTATGGGWGDLTGTQDGTLGTSNRFEVTYGGAITGDRTANSGISVLNSLYYNLGYNNFTYTCWAKAATGSFSVFYEGRGTSLVGTLWYINGGTGQMTLFLTDKPYSGQKTYTQPTSYPNGITNTVHHYAVSVDRVNSVARFFIDGVSYGTANIAPTTGSVTPDSGYNSIIMYDLGGGHFTGSMSMFSIYPNRSLTQGEIIQNFESTKRRFGL
jgi:hypothetical protein